MEIEPANTHPIWDPGWAEAGVKQRYRAQLDLGFELVRYGADLLMRAIQTAPDDVPNHLILSVLFRNALAAFDGTLVSLQSAALGAANIHLRGQMEGRWGLRLALSDPTKWGRHVYVASLRQQRFWAMRQVEGTEEHAEYIEARTIIQQYADKAPTAQDWSAYVDGISRLLERDEYRMIDAGFQAFADKRYYDPPWHYDGSAPEQKRLHSIRKLALAVDGKAEYDTLYKHASNYVHGAYTGTSLSYDENGVAVAPIRTPEGWRQAYILSVSLAVDTFRTVIDRYREGEVPVFVSKYVERWRAVIQQTPDVELVLSKLVNAS